MTDKSIIEMLGEVKNNLEYEILDAWEEQANGLFEYRGTGEHGAQQALTTLTAVMERLQTPTIERVLNKLYEMEEDPCMQGSEIYVEDLIVTIKRNPAIKTIMEEK